MKWFVLHHFLALTMRFTRISRPRDFNSFGVVFDDEAFKSLVVMACFFLWLSA